MVKEMWEELGKIGRDEVIEYNRQHHLKSYCSSVLKCLSAMKILYTNFVCNKANKISVEEFSGEIQRILRQGYLMFYYYYYST